MPFFVLMVIAVTCGAAEQITSARCVSYHVNFPKHIWFLSSEF